MRVVVALLAALGLLVSQATAAAGPGRASNAAPQAQTMSSEMAGMPGASNGIMPCCDHSKHGGQASKACNACCAMGCSVATDLETAQPVGIQFFSAPAAHGDWPEQVSDAYEPPGLKRPPKSMA